jgi:hypothetical protein
MNCWNCRHELIWECDHDLSMDEWFDYLDKKHYVMRTDLRCYNCWCDVHVWHPKDEEKNDE